MKKNKALNVVVNVVVCVILAFVLLITLSIILSGNKGYTEMFGNALVAVRSDSMKGDKKDNFNKGDLIVVEILSDAEKSDLEIGAVITFYDGTIVKDQLTLNTHRIARKFEMNGIVYYQTRGDNSPDGNGDGEPDMDNFMLTAQDIVGVHHGTRFLGLGAITNFFHSSVGFFVCVVLPSLLVVVYCGFNLYRVIKARNPESDEHRKARLERELIEKLVAEGKLPQSALDELPPEGELPSEVEVEEPVLEFEPEDPEPKE